MTAIQFISFGKRMNNLYNDLCQPVYAKYGINSTCFDILLFLANNPEYTTARDLYCVRGVKSGNASVAVETLIKNGFLKRTDDNSDRRVKHLTLTDKATPVIADGRKMQQYFMESMHTGITEEEQQSLKSVANKLSANLEKLERDKGAVRLELSDKQTQKE